MQSIEETALEIPGDEDFTEEMISEFLELQSGRNMLLVKTTLFIAVFSKDPVKPAVVVVT